MSLIDVNTKYDAFFIWNCTLHCNFRCHYCINHPNTNRKEIVVEDDFWQIYGQGKVTKMDVSAMLNSLDATGKVYLFQLTGGEPLLIPNIVELCHMLTQKHYIIVNTNLSMKNIKDIVLASVKEHIAYVVASFHVLELEKRDLVELFMENCRFLLENKIQVNLMGVGHPEVADKLLLYKQRFANMGLLLNIEPFRGFYNGKKYPLVYSEPERNDFEIVPHMDNDFFMNKNKYCNAGYNIAYVDEKADIYSCTNKQGVMLGNLYTGFSLLDTVQKCATEFCGCPFRNYDEILFDRALRETGLAG